MRHSIMTAVLVMLAGLVFSAVSCADENDAGEMVVNGDIVQLPDPVTDGEVSLERTIAGRRSRRSFSDRPLTLDQVGQVLWSGQGMTAGRFRAAPSAGATYPLELFVVVGVGAVEGLEAGVYNYEPPDHGLRRVMEGDVRAELARAALNQRSISEAPVSIVMAADYARTTGRYGERGIRYVHMEVGHVGGNIYLQCEALGLGTVAVGAFSDEQVEDITGISGRYDALYIMPVGYEL